MCRASQPWRGSEAQGPAIVFSALPGWCPTCSHVGPNAALCVQVRAAALSALARFGAACPELRDRVLLLLKRTLHDNDDEVGQDGCLGTGSVGCVMGRLGLAPAELASGCTLPTASTGGMRHGQGGSLSCLLLLLPPWPLFLSPAQVRDRATLYLYQLQHAPQGPDSVDPHWRIPARALDDALTAYLAQPDTEQPFDLVGLVGR